MPLTRVQGAAAFCSSQERKLFPLHYAPDRLGNQMHRQGAPHLGPGCYFNQEFGTIHHDLKTRPESNKGYVLSARTAARFPPCGKTGTPSPQQYQPDQSRSTTVPPGKSPFNSTSKRFEPTARGAAEDIPGPGTYQPTAATNRKVSWPMCFGRPDWSRLPPLQNQSLRVKLNSDRALVEQRSRVAYLSLYY